MVLKPEKEKEAEAIFRKWGLDFAVVGETTPTKRFIVRHNGEVMADLPIKELGDSAPEYKRPFVSAAKLPVIDADDVEAPVGIADALEKLLATPDLCSKRWVWEQYDHIILGNTVQRPGGDAAVVRVEDGPKGLALTTDVTPRYCEADPFEGGKQAVAECWRNLTAVGARPLAITDNLNFGNPERPEIMGQFVGCVRGIARSLQGARFPGRVRQRVALQRDQRQGDPADAVDRRRRPARRLHQIGDARLQARRRSDPAGRRDHRLARPVDVSARDLRARRGRAAAGRSDRGARERRFRPRADPRRHRDRGARSVRRRLAGGAGRNGDGRRHRRQARRRARRHSGACLIGSARTRRATRHRAGGEGGGRARARARGQRAGVAHRDHRRRCVDACRRAAHRACGFARQVRRLAAGLYGGEI